MARSTTERLAEKTSERQFLYELETDFELAPAASRAVLATAQQVLFASGNEPRQGQMRVTVVSVKEPSGKPLSAMKKLGVVVTVDAGLEDLEVLREFGVQGLRRARVLRMTEEAVDQEGVLTQEDLARLCQSDVRTIRRDVVALRRDGHWVPTRGAVKEIGRGQSHKAKIVEMYLRRMTYTEIVRRARHAASSVKRYVETFGRVVVLWEKGVRGAGEIGFIVGVSERLAGEYLRLRERYDTDEHRERIEEIARQVRRALNGEGEEKKGLPMRTLTDRYATVGRRDFRAALEYLLETEFKLVGSHRVIRLIAEAVVELQRQFYPHWEQLEPGTILWATTKAGNQARMGWGKRSESYGVQMVRLPLVTKLEIETRMKAGPGRDPRDNRRKEFRRDMATMVRLVKSAADQGGLLSGAELSVLMNRSLMKIHDYIRTYEQETGDPLPLKGYVLDMGSSPTHKGIICRKLEEGMSPPDIARATGHGLAAVDNYLGTYERIKVLLKKRFDVPTICQVTGKAARTVAQYLVIVERFHPELLNAGQREWLTARRQQIGAVRPLSSEVMSPMLQKLKTGMTSDSNPKAIVDPRGSGEAASRRRGKQDPKPGLRRRSPTGQKPLTGQMS